KVADDGRLLEMCVHAQMRERTNCTIIGNFGIQDYTMIFHGYPSAKPRVNNARALVKLARFADYTVTLDVNIGMNYAISSYFRLATDIGVGWINKGDAVLQH